MMKWLLLISGMLLASGCKEERNHPPVFTPDAASAVAPKTCGEVRSGEPSGSIILIDGGLAGCAADGLECPVADLEAFSTACSKGLPVAACSNSQWRVRCDLDAGVKDVAIDADADATSSD